MNSAMTKPLQTGGMSQEGAAYLHQPKLSPWLRGTDICVQSLTDGGDGRVQD